MTKNTLPNVCRQLTAIAACCTLALSTARADEFALFKGKATVVWKTTVVIGGAWRNASPQRDLIGVGAAQPNPITGARPEFPGATGAVGVNDDSNLNFKKGDIVSAPVTLITDYRLTFRNFGFFVRARAWYDMALNARSVHHGNVANMYTPNAQLSDKGFEGAAKFQGIDIYDAIYWQNFDLGSRAKLQMRLGRQAINWGEGLLYPGINAINPYDATWLAMPGATVINGGMLPVNRVYGNLALPGGWSIDGFYNLEFRGTNIPGCGTWYSMVDNAMQPGCNTATAGGARDDVSAALVKTKSYWGGVLPSSVYYPNGGPDAPQASRFPKWNESGYGIGIHQFIEPLKSEVGLFYAQYANPTPNVSTLPASSVAGSPEGSLGFAVNHMYARNLRSLAASLSTGIKNVTISGQVTQTLRYTAQRSFPTLIQGALSGIGPYANQLQYVGKEYPGFFRANITQAQAGAVTQIGQFLHLTNAQLIAETDMQWVNNFPGFEHERLNRFGNFGVGTWNGGNCDPNPAPNGIVNKCSTQGFGSPFAMGYRLRWLATLPQTKRGVVWTPVFSFGQDIKGYSLDGMIVGGRVSYGVILRADLRQRYFLELSANGYRRNAEFDPMRDRGVYQVSFGINLQ